MQADQTVGTPTSTAHHTHHSDQLQAGASTRTDSIKCRTPSRVSLTDCFGLWSARWHGPPLRIDCQVICFDRRPAARWWQAWRTLERSSHHAQRHLLMAVLRCPVARGARTRRQVAERLWSLQLLAGRRYARQDFGAAAPVPQRRGPLGLRALEHPCQPRGGPGGRRGKEPPGLTIPLNKPWAARAGG